MPVHCFWSKCSYRFEGLHEEQTVSEVLLKLITSIQRLNKLCVKDQGLLLLIATLYTEA